MMNENDIIVFNDPEKGLIEIHVLPPQIVDDGPDAYPLIVLLITLMLVGLFIGGLV